MSKSETRCSWVFPSTYPQLSVDWANDAQQFLFSRINISRTQTLCVFICFGLMRIWRTKSRIGQPLSCVSYLCNETSNLFCMGNQIRYYRLNVTDALDANVTFKLLLLLFLEATKYPLAKRPNLENQLIKDNCEQVKLWTTLSIYSHYHY